MAGSPPHTEDEIGMTLLINSYSFLVVGLLILLILTSLIWRLLGMQWAAVIITVTFAFMLILQLSTSTRVNTVSSPEDFNSVLQSGKPILLELYSNF